MRPDFSKIDFKTTPKVDQDFKEWAKQNDIDAEWLTAEQIPVKSVYDKEDLEGMAPILDDLLHYDLEIKIALS